MLFCSAQQIGNEIGERFGPLGIYLKFGDRTNKQDCLEGLCAYSSGELAARLRRPDRKRRATEEIRRALRFARRAEPWLCWTVEPELVRSVES